MSVATRFASNLVYLRKRAGFTQEDVGWRAELHRTEISQLERGLRLARIDTLIKLAGALGVTPDELLDGIDWRPGSFQPGGFRDAGEAEP